MSWTQPCCWPCWHQHNPRRRPHQIAHSERTFETCCYCGDPTFSGIYVRVDPDTVSHPTREAAQ